MTPRLLGLSLGWIPFAAGPVWLLLTVAMGYAAWLTARQGTGAASYHASLIVGLIVVCWLHPVYSAVLEAYGLRRVAELAGSILTLALALVVAAVVSRTSPRAALLLAPVLVWLAVATWYLTQLLLHERGTA